MEQFEMSEEKANSTIHGAEQLEKKRQIQFVLQEH